MNRVNGAVKQTFTKVTHTIFDLDGLLLDTEKLYTNIVATIAQKYGKIYTPEMRAQVTGRVEVEGAKIAVTQMKLPISLESYLREYRALTKKVMASVDFLPGVERLVRHLHSKHIPMAVATSSGRDTYDLKVGKHKAIFSMFSHVVTGGTDPEVERGKPNPDIFLICASRFKDKPKPNKCLVFEDAPNGVQAAIAANMQVVMVPDKDLDPKLCKLATLKLNSLEEFKPELFGLPPFK